MTENNVRRRKYTNTRNSLRALSRICVSNVSGNDSRAPSPSHYRCFNFFRGLLSKMNRGGKKGSSKSRMTPELRGWWEIAASFSKVLQVVVSSVTMRNCRLFSLERERELKASSQKRKRLLRICSRVDSVTQPFCVRANSSLIAYYLLTFMLTLPGNER